MKKLRRACTKSIHVEDMNYLQVDGQLNEICLKNKGEKVIVVKSFHYVNELLDTPDLSEINRSQVNNTKGMEFMTLESHYSALTLKR